MISARTAREAALRTLIDCRKNGAWADAALKEQLRGMERREAALATQLCYGVLQNRMLLDDRLDAFVRGKLQPIVRDILRLALYQIQFLDKIPASAAVNEAVKQAKYHANPASARLVNGVLRAILRADEMPRPPDLATRYSHPQELVELFLAQFGAEKTEALLQSHNTAPPTTIQVNTQKTDASWLIEALRDAGVEVCEHPFLPNCLKVGGTGDLERLPAFYEGRFYVQDVAARLAVTAAGIKPGMRVLDCCAAPGGKSFAAALDLEDRGELICCDIYPHKLELIRRGAERLGLTCPQIVLQNALEERTDWRGKMDVVLVDAPCSGLGVIRKKPDIRYRALDRLAELPELQKNILARQADYVRPGGVLLYSTCTVLRRENEAVAEAFLQTHPEFAPEAVHFPAASGIPDGAMTTLLPCDYDTDGFFICKFRRKS